MTQQYIASELSVLLGDLQVLAVDTATAGRLGRLRREVETHPTGALGSVTSRALALTDDLCWDSLTRGDTAMFTSRATIGALLHEFGTCAGLVDDT